MEYKKKIALVPSAYNPAVMGDIENFIEYYKDDFDVYVIVDRLIEDHIEEINGVHYVEKGTGVALYITVTADYIIDAGAISGDKHSASQKRVSVWHGIPYKKMFIDLAKEHAITAMDYAGYYDLMVSPSKWYTERFLRQSMLYEGEVLETAVSRTDSLFLSDARKKEIRDEFKIPADKKVLLYAPTFREEGDFTLLFSPDRVKASLGQDWVIVTKVHYLNKVKNAGGVIDATSYGSVNNLLAITDLLITDYSSLLFDYSVLGKPALLYQYDRDEYEAERSFMFDMEDYVDVEDIVFTEEALYERLEDYKIIGNNLSRIKETFYPHQKENATEALVKQLGFDASTRQISEVVFLVNDLNEIGGVHTFATNLARELKRKYHAKLIILGINEFNTSKEKVYLFDKDNLFDVKLSLENQPGTCKYILNYTDGIIITCQYSAQLVFQRYMENKCNILMFHGDTKDVVEKNIYWWHLDSLNSRRLYNYSQLAFLTEGNAECIKFHLKPEMKDRVISIENGFDFSKEKNLYKENGEFVFVSRLDPDKNPMEAVDLFLSDLIDPNYKLHIYGDGILRESMQKRVSEAGAEDRIVFHGYVTDKEVIYGDKQGTISISMTEGLPLTFLESINFGVPVYAYDSFTSCRDILDDTNGVYVEAGDQVALATELNHPFDMTRFSKRSITEKFSNDIITEKWKDLFDELVGKKDMARHNIGKYDADTIAANNTGALRKAKRQVKRKIKRLRKAIRKSKLIEYNENASKWMTRFKNLKSGERRKARPLVSIVIPYYNSKETINRTIKSIKTCGYYNWEIILVDDGSKEEQKPVIGNDPRIKCFRKENEGPGYARNYGIERANGKYLYFLDSDDITYPGGIKRLVEYAEEHDLDVVGGATVRYYINSGETESWYEEIYKTDYVNEKSKRNRLIDDNCATAKLFKRSFLNEHNIRFEKGLYEDALFMAQVYATVDRIGIVRRIIQKWYVYGSATSISTGNTIDNVSQRLDKADRALEFDNDILKVYYTRQFIRHHLVASVNVFSFCSDEEKREMYSMLRKSLKLREPYIMDTLVAMPSKKALYRALLEDDYEAFSVLAEAFSERRLRMIS